MSIYKINKLFLFILCTTILLLGCNTLPNDLQIRKDAVVNKLNELNSRYESASGIPAYKQLIDDYTSIRAEIVSYTAECNSRGISKNNDALIKDIDEKLSRFKTSVEISQGYSNLGSGNSNTSGSDLASKTCSYCGKSFTGNGYNYVMGECISGKDDYYSKCSMKCCSEARNNDPNLSKKWKH